MELAELEQKAKQEINVLRKEEGLRALGKLKKGVPGHISACALMMSLEGTIYHDVLDLPPSKVLTEFMFAFDDGAYPHLEIPLSPIKIKKPGERKLTVIS